MLGRALRERLPDLLVGVGALDVPEEALDHLLDVGVQERARLWRVGPAARRHVAQRGAPLLLPRPTRPLFCHVASVAGLALGQRCRRALADGILMLLLVGGLVRRGLRPERRAECLLLRLPAAGRWRRVWGRASVAGISDRVGAAQGGTCSGCLASTLPRARQPSEMRAAVTEAETALATDSCGEQDLRL